MYLSVFRGGKREFSSIAGVDSPYHSLQVAAVTRFFFFTGPVWSFWLGDLDVLYSFSPCKFWPLLEELGTKTLISFFLEDSDLYSQQEPFLNLITGWGGRASSAASWVYFNTQCCSGANDLRSYCMFWRKRCYCMLLCHSTLVACLVVGSCWLFYNIFSS